MASNVNVIWIVYSFVDRVRRGKDLFGYFVSNLQRSPSKSGSQVKKYIYLLNSESNQINVIELKGEHSILNQKV